MKTIYMAVAALVGSLCSGCVDQGMGFGGELEVDVRPMGDDCDPLDPYCEDDDGVPPGNNGTPFPSMQFLQGFFALDVPLRSGQPDANGVYALHPSVASWLSGELDAGNRFYMAKLVRKLVQYFSHVSIAIPANATPGDAHYLPAETIDGTALMRHDLSASSLGTQQLKDFVEHIMLLSVNNNYQLGTTPVMFVSDATGPDGQTLLNVNPDGRWPTLMPDHVSGYSVYPTNSHYYTKSSGQFVNDAQFDYFDPVSGTVKRMVLEYAVTGKSTQGGTSYYVAMSDTMWDALQNGSGGIVAPENAPPTPGDAGVCRFCAGHPGQCNMAVLRTGSDGHDMKVRVTSSAAQPYAVTGVHRSTSEMFQGGPQPLVAVFVPEDAIPTLYNCDFSEEEQ